MTTRKRFIYLEQLNYFLRAIGLELIPALLCRWDSLEPPKPVVRHSHWIALSRCTIHILPCVILSLLLYLNYSAVYLGPGLTLKVPDAVILALFRVATKLLEIICVASLTTVVLQALRHELMEEGVPLGFVGSGISFSQANCFWSPEMLTGILHCFRTWRRMRLLIVIVFAAPLAVAIAPSTAVLLQPRLQNVPAGGTDYYVPATADQLWPSIMDGSDEPPDCFGGNMPQRLLCASGGFESLSNYFNVLNSSFAVPSKMLGSTYSLTPIIIRSSAPQLPDLQSLGSNRGWRSETVYFQPNMITSILPGQLKEHWRDASTRWSGSPFSAVKQYKYALQILSWVTTTSPLVHVRCSATKNVSTGFSAVTFPVKSWDTLTKDTGSRYWRDDEVLFNTSIQPNHPSERVRIDWLPLPTHIFGPVSGGILLQFPGQESENSRAVMGCSVSAGWAYTPVRSDSFAFGSAWEVFDTFSIAAKFDASSSHPHDHIRPITIRSRWFESLNSVVPSEGSMKGSQPLTTLQRLFSNIGLSTVLFDMRTKPYLQYNGTIHSCEVRSPNLTMTDVERMNDHTCGNGGKMSLVELILASTFVNGLSRYGSRHAFEPESLDSTNDQFHWVLKDIPKAANSARSIISNRPRDSAILPAPPDSNFVTLSLKFEVNGFAWYTSSASDYLATAVICVYILVAVVHTLWILIRGRTSSSWDTATELLVLALQSPAAKSLWGSGAGIERLGTYERIVRLRAVDDGSEETEGVGERLVLTTEEDNRVKAGGERKDNFEMSDGLKQNIVIVTAVATSRISSSVARTGSKESQERPDATYGKVEIDKKYL